MIMDWFKDGVLSAITICREKKAVFIVYVYDKSDASQVTSEAWNDEEVLQFLRSHNYVALRLSKDSLEFNQFSQIFPVFVFPSVHCIDLRGKPLVIMHGQQTVEVLKHKLNEAFLKMKELFDSMINTPFGVNTSPPSRSAAEKTTDEDIHVPASPLQLAESSVSASSSVLQSKEEKLRRYEQKRKQRRAEKIEADKQNEKQKEKDRRELGKDVAMFKQKQIEQRNRMWLKERKKEKEDTQLAKEEVRAKIEQDRSERQANMHIQNKDSSLSSSNSTCNVSRIQLRLPMGSTKIIMLQKSDTLNVLRQRISEVLNENLTNISLVSVYPRQELTSDMDFKSMVELELAPTGIIIVKMNKKSSILFENTNVIWSTLMNFFNCIVWIFSMVKNYVMGILSSSNTTYPSIEKKKRSSNFSDTDRVRKFRQDSDDSSDDGTYNGNSTQQQ